MVWSVFERFFEAIVERCQEANLVWGKELHFDSTQAQPMPIWISLPLVLRLRHERLFKSTMLPCLSRKQHSLKNIEESRRERTAFRTIARGELAFRNRSRHLPGSLRAQCEELAKDNTARHDWIAQGGRQQRDAHGSYQRTADFRISTTDPDATPMRLKGGGIHLGYHTHYVVDGGKRRIILAVLVVPGEVMDNHPSLTCSGTCSSGGVNWPDQVTGDMTYGTAENIKAIEDAHIHAYIPIAERGNVPAIMD